MTQQETYQNGQWKAIMEHKRVSRGGFYTSYGYSYPASHRNNTTINQGVNNVGLRQNHYMYLTYHIKQT